jgi:hypothetical protein
MLLFLVVFLLVTGVKGSLCKVGGAITLKANHCVQMCDKQYELEQVKNLGRPNYSYKYL